MSGTMKTILEGVIALWNTGDGSIAEEIYSGNIVFHAPDRPEPLRGPVQIAAYVQGLRKNFPDFRLRIDETVSEFDRCAIRWTWTGTHLGRGVRQEGLTMLHVEGGRIVEDFLHFSVAAERRAAAAG